MCRRIVLLVGVIVFLGSNICTADSTAIVMNPSMGTLNPVWSTNNSESKGMGATLGLSVGFRTNSEGYLFVRFQRSKLTLDGFEVSIKSLLLGMAFEYPSSHSIVTPIVNMGGGLAWMSGGSTSFDIQFAVGVEFRTTSHFALLFTLEGRGFNHRRNNWLALGPQMGFLWNLPLN